MVWRSTGPPRTRGAWRVPDSVLMVQCHSCEHNSNQIIVSYGIILSGQHLVQLLSTCRVYASQLGGIWWACFLVYTGLAWNSRPGRCWKLRFLGNLSWNMFLQSRNLHEQDLVAAGAHKESAAWTLQFMAHAGDEAFCPPDGDVKTCVAWSISTAMGKEFAKLPIGVQVLFPCKQHLCWEETVWLCRDRPHWIDHRKFFSCSQAILPLSFALLRKATAWQLEFFPLLFSVEVPATSIRMTKSISFVETSCSGLVWKMLGMCIDHLLTCDSEVGWAIWAVQDDILGTDGFVMS